MWRLLGRFFWIVIFLSQFGFGEDFEKICNEEVLKKDFNISVIEDACLKTAEKYKEENDMDNASWYYLISNSQNINEIEKSIQKNSTVIYANLGHFYLFRKNWKQVNKYYHKFLKTYQTPNKSIQQDFKVFKKIYPQFKKEIKQAQQIWSTTYKPLHILDKLYQKNSINSLLEIIKIKKNLLGDNSFSTINDYNDLADLYFLENNYKKAIEQIQKKLAIELFNLGKESIQLSVTYQTLAALYQKNHQNNKAIESYKKILLIEENIPDNDSNIAITNYYIATLLKETGEYTLAEKFYNKALKIYTKEKKKEKIAILCNNLANIYSFQTKYKKSLRFYKKALKINSSFLGENHPKIAINHNNIGQLLDDLQDSKRALEEYNRALEILLFNGYDENHKDFSMIYNNIATILAKEGDYESSLALFKKSLAINIFNYTENSIEATANYNNIAYLLLEMGQERESLKIYYKLIKIYKKLYPNIKHPNLAIIYNNMVSILTKNAFRLKEKGEMKEAKKIYKMALIFSQKAIDINLKVYKTTEHPNIANSYSNIASILMEEGEYKKAESVFIKALGIYASTLDKDNPKIAELYNGLATLYTTLENYDKALKLYNATEKIWKKNYGEENRKLINTYHNMSALYYNQKKFHEAYVYITDSFNLFTKYRDRYFLSLSNIEKSNYIKGNKHNIRFSFLFKMAIFYRYQLFQEKKIEKLNHTTTTTLNHWLNYKGTLFEYQNILSMVKNNPKTPKNIIASINKLNHLNSQLSTTKNISKEEKLTKQIHKIEIELSKKDDTLKSILQLNEINCTQIARNLQPHQLYIDFARGNDNYYIFTIDKQNNISFQQIDENCTKAIDHNIKAFRQNTQDMADKISKEMLTQENIENSNKEAKAILTKLYNDIIEEYLKKVIKNKTHLIISPDGLLNYFPFEALYHKGQYLVENIAINYISSGKEFVRQTKLVKKHPKEEMILFANANFDAKVKAPKYLNQEQTLAPMFGATNEEKKIEKFFSNLGDIEIKVIKKYYHNPIVFREENATVKNLMEVNSSKILHISTHGTISNDKTILNPMRKAMLIFAGGNKNIKNSSISALKLSTLDLKDTELVVLSACQSGLGEIQKAEGVVGLPKALLQAGAKNVLMSLWTVSNLKTATLMEYFYANISEQQNYSHAIKNAKVKMIQKHPHPYFWSAFVLSGLSSKDIP